jgi:parvulin-like peptidyl-prolyl isomerase
VKNSVLVMSLSALVACSTAKAADVAVPVKAETPQQAYFAIVDKETVPQEEYLVAVQQRARDKYYHGSISAEKLDELRTEVTQGLVDQVLLTQEAKKRGLQVDASIMAKRLQAEEAKFAKQRSWAKKKDVLLPFIKKRIEREEYVKLLEQRIKDINDPPDKDKLDYYKDNPDKFTAPEEWNVSLIMLKVDPSSPASVWQETADMAADLVQQIRNGANFEELARIHSGDESAVDGGNMGYMHTGMLAKPAQEVLNVMSVGDISEPVMLLQGVAIFRLNDIQSARLNPYQRVEEKVGPLLKRENADQTWKSLLQELRQQKQITVNNDFVNTVALDNIDNVLYKNTIK